MSSKRLTICVLLLVVILIPAGIAQACWAGLTPDELFNQSDLIIAGRINGSAGEFQKNSSWMTNWNVQVDYIFQGVTVPKAILVATPGADGKGGMTSIDYDLNAWGDYVLLFLREQDGFFEPLSPQGVLALTPTDEKIDSVNTGEDFLRIYQFTDNESQDLKDIGDMLKTAKVTLPDNNNQQTTVRISIFTRIIHFFRSLFV